MIYDLNIEGNLEKAKELLTNATEMGKVVEVKEHKPHRTSQQNKSLHKFFTIIANELNEMGKEFTYTGLNVESVSTMYTPQIVKDFFWRPIQVTLFDIESTRDLTTDQMNKIIDVIVKFFGEKSILVEFPSMDNMIKTDDNG